MTRSSRALKVLSASLVFTTLSTWTLPIYADNLPAGYESVSGLSSYNVDGTTGTLTANDAVTIGQWHEGFNIGQGYTFNAFLPENGVHLSRDISRNPSEIYGSLNVPRGKFFLVNTSGIFFSPTAQVNAAGLVASTLDVLDSDFLSGQYRFAKQADMAPAALVNQGAITLGRHGGALIGGAVENTGVIIARESNLALASGNEATLTFDSAGMLSVIVDKPVTETVKDNDGQALKDAVKNSGIVKTEGGTVIMTAEAADNIFDSLVNNTGIIEAQSLGSKEGKVVLSSKKSNGIVRNSGAINASGKEAGEKGGKVVLEGQIVGNEGNIDASGANGGGTVLIGGDYQGRNANVRNADYAYQNSDASVNVSATENGDGGKAIIWSDKGTYFHGDVQARGGAQGGNGGFVETSGKEYLEAMGSVNASAPNGAKGQWLLDPANIEIKNAASANGAFSGGNPNTFTPTANPSVADRNTIQTSLNGGTDVTITTVGAPGAGSGDITVVDSILKSAGGNAVLTLLADGAIIINNTITSTLNKLAMIFSADDGITVNAALDTLGGNFTANSDVNGTGAGTFTVGVAGSILASGGNVSITAADIALSNSVSAGAGLVTLLASGNKTIGIGSNKNFTLMGSELQLITADTLTIGDAVNNDVTVDGITATNSNNVSNVVINAKKATSKVTFSGAASTFNALGVNAGNDVVVNSNLSTDAGDASINADFTKVGNGNFTVANGTTLTSAGGLSIIANDIDLNTSGALNAASGNTALLVSDGGTVRLGSGSGNFALSGSELQRITTNNLTIGDDTNNNVTIDGVTAAHVANVNGTLTVNATGAARSVTFSGADSTFENLSVNAGNGVIANVNVTTTAGGFTADADADSNGTGNFTVLNSKTVGTSGNALAIRANDVVLGTSGALNSGAANTKIEVSDDGTLGLGNAVGGMTINATELSNITAGSLTLGGADTGDITADSVNLGVTTLIAGSDNASIAFDNANTFDVLSATADDGIEVNGTLTTDVGGMTLEGDSDSSADDEDNILLAGNLDSAGSIDLSAFSGGIDLGADVNVNAGGDVTFSDAVDGAQDLNVDAGANGVSFLSAVGSATPLASLIVNAADILLNGVTTTGSQDYTGDTTLSGNLASTAGGDITITGDTTIDDLDGLAGTIDTVTVTTNGGNVTFDGKTDGTIDYEQSLTVNTGAGDVEFTDAIGSIVPLHTLTLNGTGTQTLPSVIDVLNFTLSTLNLAGDMILNLGAGAFTVGAVDLNGFNLTIIADEINFQGGAASVIDGLTTSTVTLQAFTNALKIVVAGAAELAGQLDITVADLDAFASGLRELVIGAATATGGIDINAYGFTSGVEFVQALTTGGDINVLGNISNTGGTVTLTGSGTTTNLSANIVTAGFAILIADSVNLLANILLDTTDLGATGADITITGTTNGAFSLTTTAGSTGDLDLQANVGNTAALTGLTVNSATTARFGGNVATTGSQIVTAGTTFTNGAHTTSVAGSAISIGGALELQNDTALNTNNGNVTVSGAVNSDTAAHKSLNVTAGTASVDLQSAVGDTQALSSLTVNSATTARFGSSVATDGAQSVTASTIRTNGAHTLNTAGADLTFTGNVELQNNASIDTNDGDAVVNGTVNGARSLSVDAETGLVSLNGNVGAGTALTALTVTDAGTARFGGNVATTGNQSVTATSIQTNGTHSVSTAGSAIGFTGNVTLQNDTNLNTNNGNVTVTGTMNGPKALSIAAGTGAIAVGNAIGGTSALSSVLATGATIGLKSVSTSGSQAYNGATSLDGAYLSTTAGSITVNGSATLAGDATFQTAGGATDDVTFNGTVNGPNDLAVTTGLGDILFQFAAGGTSALQTLTATGATIGLKSVTTTGNQTYTGATSLDGSYTAATNGINLNGAVTLAGNTAVTTNGGGYAVFNGAVDGAKSLTAIANGGGSVSFANGVGQSTALTSLSATAANVETHSVATTGSQTYTGTTSLDGSYVSTGAGAISVNGNAQLTADTTVQTAGLVSSDDISITGTVNGAFDLILDAGNGDVSFGGSVGAISALTSILVDAATILLNGVTTTGNQTYNGATTLSGDLTATGAGNVTLNGDTVIDDLDATPATVDLVTVTTNGGDVTFNGKTDGTVHQKQSLTVQAGAGDLTFTDSIGSIVALNTLTLVNTGAQTLPAIINVLNLTLSSLNLAADKILNLGTGTFSVGTVNTNGFNLTLIADEINFTAGAGTVSGGGNITLRQFTNTLKVVTAGALEVAGQLDLTFTDLSALANGFASIVLGSASGTGGIDINAFTFQDPTSFLSPLAGQITLLGTLTGSGNASFFIDGANATFHMLASILTAGGSVTISDNVILEANGLSINTTDAAAPGANITVTGTIEGDADATRSLSLTAGTGTVNLQGSVGATNRLSNFSVLSAAASTFAGQVRTAFAQIYNGNTTFNGNVQAGGAMTLNNAASSNMNADVSVQSYTLNNVAALNLAGNSDIVTTGGDLNTGVAAVNLNGASGTTNILTAFGGATGALTLGTVTAASGANLTGSSSGNTSVGSVNLNGGALSLTVDSNNNSSNTLTAGPLSAGTISIAGTGNDDDIALNGAVTSTTGAVSVQNADDVNANADVTAATSLTVGNASDLILGSNVDLLSQNGNVDLSGLTTGTTLGAAGTNRIDANGGSAIAGGLVGAGANLIVTAQQNIAAGIISLGTGALTMDVDTDNNGSNTLTAGGISAGSVELTGSGSNDSATLGSTVTATGTTVLVDGFNTVTANGDVQAATSVTVSNTNSLALAQDVDVRALAGNVQVGNMALNGAAGTNVLDSNGGSVTTGNVSTTGDANLTINSQNDITTGSVNIADAAFTANVDDDSNGSRTATFGALTADTVTVTGTNGNDTLNFNGALNASGNVQATGGAVNVNAPVNTTSGGTVTISNAGLLTVAAAADMLLDGAFTQNGAGLVSLAGDIATTNDAIDFASAVTLAGNVTLVSMGASIHFDSTLDGTFDLVVNAGSTGNVLFDLAVGMGTQLGNLVIQNANDVTLGDEEDMHVASLTQLAGSGLTSFTGNILSEGDIELTGHDFLLGDLPTLSDTIETNNGGDLCITTDALGTFTLNADVSGIEGEFCVLGGGTFNLNVDVTNFNGITLDTNVILGGAGTGRILNAGTNVITLGALSSVNAGSFDFSLIADEIDLLGAANTIASDGDETLTLSPFTQGLDLTIGGLNGTSALDLTVAEVATFTSPFLGDDNWGSVLIGNANGSGNITVNAITFSDATTIRTPQAPGSLYINGQVTGFDDATLTFDGSGSTLFLAANIVTMGGLIHIMDSVILMADVMLDTTNGGGVLTGANIQIDGAVNSNLFGQDDLTLNAGSAGNILLGSPVGLGNRIGALVIQNVNNFTSADLRARSITQVDGQGTSLYQGALNTDGAAGISLTGNNLTLNVSSAVTTTQGGGFTADHDGLLDISSSAPMSLDGAFLEQSTAATGTVQLGSDITTTNDDITFNRATTLSDHVTLNSAGGDIALNGTVNATTAGDQNLTLIAGTGNPLDGDITAAAMGAATRLGVFSARNAVDFTTAGITAAEVNVSNVSGTAAFNGVINTNTVNGIEIQANDVTLNGAITTTNGGDMNVTQNGLLNITAAGDMNLDGEFRQTNGTLVSTANLAGDITTSAGNDISFAAPVTLTGASVQNSGRDIRFGSSVDGAQNLTLTAVRDIFMDGAAGNAARLGALIVTTARNWTSAGIRALSIQQNAGTGTTTFNGPLDTNGAAGIDLNGNVYNVNSAVLTTNGGTFTVTNAGALNIAAAGDMNLDGNFLQDGAGQVNTAGNITTSADDITFLGAVNLTGPVSIDSNNGGITFNSTVNGGQNLTLEANGGNIAMNGAVGAGTRLGALVVNSVATWTANSTITAQSILQVAGTGATTFNGALNTNGAAGIDLNGSAFTLNAPVTATNGPVSITNGSQLTIAAAADINAASFTQDGAGGVVTAGDVTTTGGAISFASDLVLTGNVSMASNNGAITFNNTVDSDGTPTNLTLAAGTGDITMNDAIGSLDILGALVITTVRNWIAQSTISANSILQSAGTGTTTWNDEVDTDAAAGIDLNGQNFVLNAPVSTANGGTFTITNAGTLNIAEAGDMTLDGAFLQDGAGQVNTAGEITTTADNITFNAPVNLTGPVSLDSNGGNIVFNNVVNGAANLILEANAGNITMNAAVGALVRLAGLVVTSAANWTANSSISASTITQSAGSGTTTFNGALNTNGALGIDLAGTAFNVNQSVTTTNGGPVTITHTGALNIAAAGDMNLDGAFLEQGGGAVITAGDLTTTNDSITWNGPISLTGPVSMDSNGGSITFNNAIDGGQNLTLEANAGNITMNAGVGLGTRLAALLVTAANNWTANAGINAASIAQNSGTGLTDFNGALDANGAAGINVTTANVNFDANATASAGDVRANAANDVNVNGTLNASQDIDLQAGNDLTQAAARDMLAGRDAKLDANNALTLNGTVGAGAPIGRNIEIGQRNNNADVIANAMTANGAVTVNGDDVTLNGTVIADFNIAGGEALNVSANDKATSNLNVNAGMFTTGGPINLTANNNVNMAAAGDVTSNNGNVLVRADLDGNNAGALTMTYGAADQTVINSGTGTTTLRSGGNITLGRVVTTNATDAAVTMQSTAGRIIDGGENVALDVDAANGGLALSAANGIGLSTDAFGAIETNARRLSATTVTGGINVDVTSTQALVVANASVTGGPGDILIRQLAELPMTILGASTVNGDITFTSFGDLIAAGNVAAGGLGSALTLIADANSNGAGNLTVNPGAILSANGPILLQGINVNQMGAIISAGLVSIQAAGQLLIEFIQAGQVQLVANGDILDANGEEANIVASGPSFIQSVAGTIGRSLDALEVFIGEGDLTVQAGGFPSDGISAHLAGEIAGNLIINLTPGLVMFNNIAAGGETLPFLNTALASTFDIVATKLPYTGFNEARTLQGIMAGHFLSRQYERNLEPALDVTAAVNVPQVLVNEEERKRRSRVAPAPVAPVVRPTPVVPVPTVQAPAPAPIPVLEPAPAPKPTPALVQPVKVEPVKPAEVPLVPPVMPFPPAAREQKPEFGQPTFKPGVDTAGPAFQPQPLPGGARLFQQSIEEEAKSQAATKPGSKPAPTAPVRLGQFGVEEVEVDKN